MLDNSLIAAQEPKSNGQLTNYAILMGPPIPAIDRLKIVSPSEFEDIIREWIAGYCKSKYVRVWRSGGANDKGRDVVAIINEVGDYDNFQSKHYDHPLTPSDIWQEVGKLAYYTWRNEYKLPRKYYFVAPQGVGPKLGNFLEKPSEFKMELLKEWDDKCKNNISDKVEIFLTNELKDHIEKIDFSIFTFLDPQDLLEQHKQTNYYAARFGGGLQNRDKPSVCKFKEAEYSLRYVEQLFEAYSDHTKFTIKNLSELHKYEEQYGHFSRQRECFYWAEALYQFSRDHLPPDSTCFEDLKDEIYQGIVDVSNQAHLSGYMNVIKTTNEAQKLNLQSNALLTVAQIQDKIGICHHLANENKLIWVKK